MKENIHLTCPQSPPQSELLQPLSDEEKAACAAAEAIAPRQKKTLWRRARSHKSILVATIMLVTLLLLALFGPIFSPYAFDDVHLSQKNLSPSPEHLFGTDELGRDLWTRVCCGLRVSLSIGLLAAAIDLIIGVTWGIAAGYIGGIFDQIIMRIAEMIYSLPYLVFVILVTTIIGPGVIAIVSAMVLIGWIQMARVARQLVLQVKNAEYVTAAISLGARPFQIIRRHILPNIFGPIVAVVMLTIPYAIFVEAFLSFLGIGIQPPTASLGSLVSDAIGSMRYYPWKLFIPASVITLCIFAFNLLGDGIRDLLDPQSSAYLKSTSSDGA
jgi:ABC-type dipeptide/oligopeptide/nickel transport system permease subunit